MRGAARRSAVLVVLVSALLCSGVLTSVPPAAAAPTTNDLLYALTLVQESSAGLPAGPTVTLDEDGDGCDTRSEVLQRESEAPVTVGAGCTVLTGLWRLRGGDVETDATQLDVVPLVGLREAWQSGAHAWSPAQRQAFLDDLTLASALVVVRGRPSDDASGDDPSSWPTDGGQEWCFAARSWVEVKARWHLAADIAERRALGWLVLRCGPYSAADVAEAPTPVPAPRVAVQRTQTLAPGAELVSPGLRYRFVMQRDGDAVVHGPRGAEWSTRTTGVGHRLEMGSDANLVVRDAGGRAVWSTGTAHRYGTYVVMQDDGNLVMYGDDHVPVWSTHTGVLPELVLPDPPPPPAPTPLPVPSDVTGPGELPPSGLPSALDRYRLVRISQAWVVRDAKGRVLWSTRTAGERRQDPFTTRLTFQGDGNLVEQDRLGGVLWSSGTRGSGATRLVMQDDANLVLYRTDGRPVWSTQTGPLWPFRDVRADQPLDAGAGLRAADGSHRFEVQGDGNLVVYARDGRAVWNSGTYLGTGRRLVLQADGNLVLSDRTGRPVWWTGTDGRGADRLVMQPDGNLVLYRADGRPVWSTVTGRL